MISYKHSRPKGGCTVNARRYLVAVLFGFCLGSFSTVLQLGPHVHSTLQVTVQQPSSSATVSAQPGRAWQKVPIEQSSQAQLATHQQLAENGHLYVATAANSAYFSGLTNLVGSLRYWCPECQVLAYNLGLTPSQLDTVRSWRNVTIQWADGLSGGQHLKDAKKYAWKPLAILDAVNTYKHVLWLDAGSTVTSPLRSTVWPLLLMDGHFLVQGQDNDMVPWCHGLTWEFFNLDKEKFRGKPSYSGNTVGFIHGSPGYHKILKPWVECAKVEACMAPPGTSTTNHRFDQSVLSIITYTAGLNVTEHTELLLATGVPCFKAHPRAVWTSRQGCNCYQKFAGTCVAAAGYDHSYLPMYPMRRLIKQ